MSKATCWSRAIGGYIAFDSYDMPHGAAHATARSPFLASKDGSFSEGKKCLARPERLELPTYWFEASRSIHLSYGRAPNDDSNRAYASATTGFTNSPTPSTRTFTSSPAFNHR